MKAAGLGAALLVANIDLARGVLADDYDREAGFEAVSLEQFGRLGRDVRRQLGCPGFSIDASGGFGPKLAMRASR